MQRVKECAREAKIMDAESEGMATKAEILARERERRVEEAKILVGERKKEARSENTGWREKEEGKKRKYEPT